MKIWVSTEQKIKQHNETTKYRQQTEGELVEKRVPYITYIENLEGQKIKVRVKLDPQGVKVLRRGAVSMDFHFVEGETTQNIYTTEAGRTVMDITTTKLSFKKLTAGGRLLIHYTLSEHGIIHGQFKYQLDYKEMTA